MLQRYLTRPLSDDRVRLRPARLEWTSSRTEFFIEGFFVFSLHDCYHFDGMVSSGDIDDGELYVGPVLIDSFPSYFDSSSFTKTAFDNTLQE